MLPSSCTGRSATWHADRRERKVRERRIVLVFIVLSYEEWFKYKHFLNKYECF